VARAFLAMRYQNLILRRLVSAVSKDEALT
jgi:hypothetical protein